MGNDCGDFTKEHIKLEKFYVYKSLHSDNSWGAIVLDAAATNLPNICFGMKVFAVNEAAAIYRARKEYERIHKNDNDKENIKRFMMASLSGKELVYESQMKEVLNGAIELNKLLKEHFGEDDEQIPGNNEGSSGQWEINES